MALGYCPWGTRFVVNMRADVDDRTEGGVFSLFSVGAGGAPDRGFNS
jgi:hypothetical protein